MYPQSLLRTNEIVFKAVLNNLMVVKLDFLRNYWAILNCFCTKAFRYKETRKCVLKHYAPNYMLASEQSIHVSDVTKKGDNSVIHQQNFTKS